MRGWGGEGGRQSSVTLGAGTRHPEMRRVYRRWTYYSSLDGAAEDDAFETSPISLLLVPPPWRLDLPLESIRHRAEDRVNLGRTESGSGLRNVSRQMIITSGGATPAVQHIVVGR